MEAITRGRFQEDVEQRPRWSQGGVKEKKTYVSHVVKTALENILVPAEKLSELCVYQLLQSHFLSLEVRVDHILFLGGNSHWKVGVWGER